MGQYLTLQELTTAIQTDIQYLDQKTGNFPTSLVTAQKVNEIQVGVEVENTIQHPQTQSYETQKIPIVSTDLKISKGPFQETDSADWNFYGNDPDYEIYIANTPADHASFKSRTMKFDYPIPGIPDHQRWKWWRWDGEVPSETPPEIGDSGQMDSGPEGMIDHFTKSPEWVSGGLQNEGEFAWQTGYSRDTYPMGWTILLNGEKVFFKTGGGDSEEPYPSGRDRDATPEEWANFTQYFGAEARYPGITAAWNNDLKNAMMVNTSWQIWNNEFRTGMFTDNDAYNGGGIPSLREFGGGAYNWDRMVITIRDDGNPPDFSPRPGFYFYPDRVDLVGGYLGSSRLVEYDPGEFIPSHYYYKGDKIKTPTSYMECVIEGKFDELTGEGIVIQSNLNEDLVTRVFSHTTDTGVQGLNVNQFNPVFKTRTTEFVDLKVVSNDPNEPRQGVITPSMLTQFEKNTADIASLKGKGRLVVRDTYPGGGDSDIINGGRDTWFMNKWLDAFNQAPPEEGCTIVTLGTWKSNHTWTYINEAGGLHWIDRGTDTVTTASNTHEGVVKGLNGTNAYDSANLGAIRINDSGEMFVNGWDGKQNAITNSGRTNPDFLLEPTTRGGAPQRVEGQRIPKWSNSAMSAQYPTEYMVVTDTSSTIAANSTVDRFVTQSTIPANSVGRRIYVDIAPQDVRRPSDGKLYLSQLLIQMAQKYSHPLYNTWGPTVFVTTLGVLYQYVDRPFFGQGLAWSEVCICIDNITAGGGSTVILHLRCTIAHEAICQHEFHGKLFLTDGYNAYTTSDYTVNPSWTTGRNYVAWSFFSSRYPVSISAVGWNDTYTTNNTENAFPEYKDSDTGTANRWGASPGYLSSSWTPYLLWYGRVSSGNGNNSSILVWLNGMMWYSIDLEWHTIPPTTVSAYVNHLDLSRISAEPIYKWRPTNTSNPATITKDFRFHYTQCMNLATFYGGSVLTGNAESFHPSIINSYGITMSMSRSPLSNSQTSADNRILATVGMRLLLTGSTVLRMDLVHDRLPNFWGGKVS